MTLQKRSPLAQTTTEESLLDSLIADFDTLPQSAEEESEAWQSDLGLEGFEEREAPEGPSCCATPKLAALLDAVPTEGKRGNWQAVCSCCGSVMDIAVQPSIPWNKTYTWKQNLAWASKVAAKLKNGKIV